LATGRTHGLEHQSFERSDAQDLAAGAGVLLGAPILGIGASSGRFSHCDEKSTFLNVSRFPKVTVGFRVSLKVGSSHG
jgi:hypothetical protein